MTARDLLLSHKARLEAVVRDNAAGFVVAQARTFLGRVEWGLKNLGPLDEGTILGLFGPNGHGPAIEGVVRDSEIQGRLSCCDGAAVGVGSERVGVASGPGCQPSASAPPLRSGSSLSGIPNARKVA